MIALARDFPLARLTTVRTGGAAELFARPGTRGELVELLAWAQARELEVNVVGSGSNLLVADEGVRGLVLKLERELARIEPRRDGLRCGGGARMPAIAARAAALGLAGIEFAVNIPGTLGGAVRMNANAYGGELEPLLVDVELASGDGVERVPPSSLGLAYRSSALPRGSVVAGARVRLRAAAAADVRATLAELRERRHAAQPKGIRTFGSTFKNPAAGPSAGLLLAAAIGGELRVGGARLSPVHANFVENLGGASTAEVIELIARARALVLERHGVALEPEVQVLGEVSFPWSEQDGG